MSTEAPTKTIKNIRAHSAKLKINLHPSSAQVGPPSKALLIPAKNPKYSICVSRGMPQFGVNIEISSTDKFADKFCLELTIKPNTPKKL